MVFNPTLPTAWQGFLSPTTLEAFDRALARLKAVAGPTALSGLKDQPAVAGGPLGMAASGPEGLQGSFYPRSQDLFRAFDLVDPQKVRVVILGQDPYHGPGQAHGLAFSVPQGTRLHPSLRNIFKELSSDLGQDPPLHGDLSPWAAQGVFLLNCVLSVQPGLAGSHQNLGWQAFTDGVIGDLSVRGNGTVFILWGSYAQEKKSLIDSQKHLVLTAAHPSPLSAYRGFFGSRPFSQANAFLAARGSSPVQWISAHSSKTAKSVVARTNRTT